mgnify:CR=1 FL=1|jgi:hypothetical protein
MARFLTTIPNNLGYYNLGTVQAYPTGGSGPTAYGPNSYFGSDPLPSELGDSLYNPVDLGDVSSVFRSITLTNTHGGLSRRQTTFYKIRLFRKRKIQFTQNFSQFAYTQNTNRNTLIAVYRLNSDNTREELPINNEGYVSRQSSIDYNDDETLNNDYPSNDLDPGTYLFLITNDIRFLETTYSITVGISILDWRFVDESVDSILDFDSVTAGASELLDFGLIRASL